MLRQCSASRAIAEIVSANCWCVVFSWCVRVCVSVCDFVHGCLCMIACMLARLVAMGSVCCISSCDEDVCLCPSLADPHFVSVMNTVLLSWLSVLPFFCSPARSRICRQSRMSVWTMGGWQPDDCWNCHLDGIERSASCMDGCLSSQAISSSSFCSVWSMRYTGMPWRTSSRMVVNLSLSSSVEVTRRWRTYWFFVLSGWVSRSPWTLASSNSSLKG